MLNIANRSLISVFISVAFLSACSTTAILPSKEASSVREPKQVKVYFHTDRAPDRDEKKYFSGERGDLYYGIAQVGIPAGHLMGKHEEPSLLKFEWSPDEHKHIKISDVFMKPKDDFILELSEAVSNSPGKKVMVFVHGYNVEFTEASKVVAQFTNDLKFSGPVVLFSWPSQGTLTGYSTDETNTQWATAHFVDFMKTLLEEVPAKDIYLVAHSMGSRILGNGFTKLASDLPKSYLALFREIVLIAPDIDADVFRQDMAPRLARTGIHTTLYASSNDRALKASKAFHGYARAGDSGEGVVVVDGVETVDVSDASGGLLGHSYFAEDRRIMEDIFSLLQSGHWADGRFGLQAVGRDEGKYWTFRK
jgi:esterase/lipase superfamily enzyme